MTKGAVVQAKADEEEIVHTMQQSAEVRANHPKPEP